MSDIFEGLHGLEQGLDYHAMRHTVLASNLANYQTPGYKEKDITFEQAMSMQGQLTTTNTRHLPAPQSTAAPFVQFDESEPSRADDNGVRMERAMAKLTANRLRYETGIELARRRLAMLRYAAGNGAG